MSVEYCDDCGCDKPYGCCSARARVKAIEECIGLVCLQCNAGVELRVTPAAGLVVLHYHKLGIGTTPCPADRLHYALLAEAKGGAE